MHTILLVIQSYYWFCFSYFHAVWPAVEDYNVPYWTRLLTWWFGYFYGSICIDDRYDFFRHSSNRRKGLLIGIIVLLLDTIHENQHGKLYLNIHYWIKTSLDINIGYFTGIITIRRWHHWTLFLFQYYTLLNFNLRKIVL